MVESIGQRKASQRSSQRNLRALLAGVTFVAGAIIDPAEHFAAPLAVVRFLAIMRAHMTYSEEGVSH